jgi:hypothetical protein
VLGSWPKYLRLSDSRLLVWPLVLWLPVHLPCQMEDLLPLVLPLGQMHFR